MEWDSFRGIVKTKIQTNKDDRIQRLFLPALGSQNTTESEKYRLSKIGALVGLSSDEVRSTTDYRIGAVSRLCSRMLLVLVLGFFILIMLSMAAADAGWTLWDLFQEAPTTTYTPGTRYGSISPSDFD